MREAVQFLTDQDKCGVYLPTDKCSKTNKPVWEVFKSKHSKARTPSDEALPTYPTTPDLVDLDITSDVVERVASKLSGSAGLGGVDALDLKHWLLSFGKVSMHLREVCTNHASWLGK